MQIDFKALARDLRERARDVLPLWLPAGRFRGREFVAGSVQGEAGDSLSINWTTGEWKDFATADVKGGDLISLFAAINGVSMSEAARLLSGISSTPIPVTSEKVKGKPKRKVVAPAPKSAGFPPCVHYQYKEATAVYTYRDAAGAILGAVARYDPPGMKKQVIPWTWQIDESSKGHWRMGSWDTPRPLYGLDDLAARPDQPVLIVEGEKCADAARMLMPQYVCMSWVGGSGGYTYVDWSPLKGRKILLWPDADTIGVSVMWAIGYKLLRICPSVKMIFPGADLPDGWDVADAIKQEGFNNVDAKARWEYFKQWALPLIEELKEDFRDVEQKGSRATGGNSGDDGPGEATAREGGGNKQDSEGVGRSDRAAATGSDAQSDIGNEMGRAGADATAGSEMADGDGGRTARDPVQSAAERNSDDDSKGAVAVAVVADDKRDARANGRSATARSGTSKARNTEIESGASTDDSAPGRKDRLPEKSRDETATAPRLNREIYWPRWRFDMSANGTPLQNLNNAVATLENDPEWKGKIWYDTFLQRIIADIPGGDGPREWSDFDDVNLTLYMQRTIGLTKISSDIVAKAVVQIARSNLKHCVRDWLDALVWDGTERIEHFFEDHFGAAGSNYTKAVSRNLWMSIVARTYLPGCKQDYMVVLEGPQGNGKSSAIEAIASRPWFAVASESVLSKEFFSALQGKLVIEISELDAFDRADATRVKMVLSTSEDRFRLPYDRHPADHPRQNIFVASTNRYDSNKDDTGARRNWYIRCQGPIDVAGIRVNREQLFAEAVARFKKVDLKASLADRLEAGADWWNIPTAEAEAEQEKRFQEDSWSAHVVDYLGLRDEVRIGEILTEALKIEIGKVKRTDELRAASVLRSLGWEKSDARRDGKVVKIWVAKKEREF